MTYDLHPVGRYPYGTLPLFYALERGRLSPYLSPLCPCAEHAYPGWRIYRPRRTR